MLKIYWFTRCCSVTQSYPTLCTPWSAARQASLYFTISWSLLKFMPIESVMPSNHFILCHHLLFLPSIFLSTRVFSNESILCIMWPKYWSFSFSISPFNEYSRLISFSMDRFDLPAVLGNLNNLLQHCSSRVSIPCCSLSLWSSSHIHTDYSKTRALMRWNFIYMYKHVYRHT